MSETITSANSIFTITVPGIFPAPVQLQGYAADKAWDTDQQEIGETLMGVDGHLSGGYVPNPVKQNIHLQADSPSKAIFNAIALFIQQSKDTFAIYGNITLPSTGQTFICKNGFLTGVKAVPDAAKVLQPMDFVIVWERIIPGLL